MSFTIPMISLAWVMPEIARTSVRLSENTSRAVISRVIAMQRADLIAEASAIRGYPIERSITDPLIGNLSFWPEKIQAKPAIRLSLFQAASVLQVTRFSSATPRKESRVWLRSVWDKLLPFLTCACDVDHSLANLIPLNAVSSGV